MFRHCFGFLAGLFLLVASGAQVARADSSAVPSIVLRASATFETMLHGVVGMQRHFLTRVHVGPVTHEEQSDSGLLLQDGRFARIAYFRIVRDGHPFSSAQIQQRDDESNEDWAAGKVFFKEPYDERYVSDYTFTLAQPKCSGCPAGTQAINFTSMIHDSQHGAGTMYIDPTTARVERLIYTPYVLPSHASSGVVTEVGGQSLPDLWYAVRITQTYRGSVLLMRGQGAFTGVFDNVRRFASLDAGEAALRSHSI